jgi:hypothetical protein
VADPTDDQLDTYIRARLDLIGVSLDDLPVDDPLAPADQVRTLASLRTFLRRVPPAISEFPMDVQVHLPGLYPAPLGVWTGMEVRAPGSGALGAQ